MTTYRLRISEKDFTELQRLVWAARPREAAAFGLVGVSHRGDSVDLLFRRSVEVPADDYRIQEEYHLDVSPRAINGLAALCEANKLGGLLCHSHPTEVSYSPSDDHGESRIFTAIRPFLPAEAPTASLLFRPTMTEGRIWLAGEKKPRPLSEITVVGRRIRRIKLGGNGRQEQIDDELYDRQVRAFGREGQALIARVKVAIVGTGGTGSPTAEQLTRLGVRDILLIDPDGFQRHNLTRVYGTFPLSRSRFRRDPREKVEQVAKHLRHIAPAAHIKAIARNVVLTDSAKALLDRDVIFLCTDDHWGRSVVNQIAYQYLIPVINMGARIAAPETVITAAVGTIDVLRPDLPCLWCSQFLRSERITAESLPRSLRRGLEREGYVEGLDDPAPSVVSMTTAVSAMSVSLFLQLLTDFMGEDGDIARLNYNVLDGTVRRGRAQTLGRCVCRSVRGFGDLRNLPTLDDLSFLNK